MVKSFYSQVMSNRQNQCIIERGKKGISGPQLSDAVADATVGQCLVRDEQGL